MLYHNFDDANVSVKIFFIRNMIIFFYKKYYMILPIHETEDVHIQYHVIRCCSEIDISVQWLFKICVVILS